MSFEYLLKKLKSGKYYNYFSELGFLPNPDRLISRKGSSYESLRELKSDPHIWSCIQSRKSGVLNLDFAISGSNDAIVNEIKQIINKISIHQLIRDILEAPLFGFQPLEIIWEKAGKNKFLPKSVIPLKQDNFIFGKDSELLFNTGERLTPVSKYKIINARYEASDINPYGESLLSKCYWSAKFKTAGMKLWVTYMEKFGLPYITGKLNRMNFNDESDELLDNLSDMSEGSVFIAPEDVDLHVVDTNKRDANALYKELIKNCNAEISKAILSQTLTTEMEMGSYAASQTHFKIRREVINSDARLAEKVINELIRNITEINYSGYEPPKFRFIINDADDTSKIERDTKLMQSGIKFTKEYWQKTYGFSPEDIAEC